MNKERLLKIVDHLRNGQLGHEKFDFQVINRGGTYDHPCGTSGCAFGEFPIIFPETWKYKKLIMNFLPVLIEYPVNTPFEGWKQLENFLEITSDESGILFVPSEDGKEDEKSYLSNGKTMYQLSQRATKEEVADNILEFIRLKEL